MWGALAIMVIALALMLDWSWVRCAIFGHPLRFSRPYETPNGFRWTATCTRCPERGELSVECKKPEDKDRLFVYCPETDHPMSPRYCMTSPHLPTCADCVYKANPSAAERA